jgi:hypothetical protein
MHTRVYVYSYFFHFHLLFLSKVFEEFTNFEMENTRQGFVMDI